MVMDPDSGSEKKEADFVEFALAARSTPTSNDKLSLWQATKQNAKIVGYCLSLSNVILLYGYDLVIVGTVSALPQFQYVLSSSQTSR